MSKCALEWSLCLLSGHVIVEINFFSPPERNRQCTDTRGCTSGPLSLFFMGGTGFPWTWSTQICSYGSWTEVWRVSFLILNFLLWYDRYHTIQEVLGSIFIDDQLCLSCFYIWCEIENKYFPSSA